MLKLNLLFQTNPANYFTSLLPFCQKIQELKALNSLLIVNGLIKNKSLTKQFIQQCCHQGFPNLSLPIFKKLKKPSPYLQNLLLRSLSDNGLFRDLQFVYTKCRNSGVFPDNYTYPFVIKSCAVLGDLWFGKLMHCDVVKSGFGNNSVVGTSILDFYSKIGEMGCARKVFDEMAEPDLVSWNALVSGYSVNGLNGYVFEAFQELIVAGLKPNGSTLATIFPVCSRVEVFGFGDSLFGLACKLGYSSDESLAPAVISMYGNCGDLLAATNVFDVSGGNNVFVWNAMMSCYMRNHRPENGIALFRKMLLSDVKPDDATFVSLLQCSDSVGSVWTVEPLHAHVVKYGFEEHLSICTALISTYAKLGSIVSSEFLFNYVPSKNILLWNSMVSAYVGNGLWEKSLHVFHAMQINGFDPDSISIISILTSCSELEATLMGKSTHAFTLRKGIDSSLNLSNAFLLFYRDRKEMAYSSRMFNRMLVKNVVSWNVMITGCVNNGESERAMTIFHQMCQERVNFDMVTLVSILPSCYECQNIMLGLSIHSYAIKSALITDISLANALVSMYVNCTELNDAKVLFDDMPDKNVVSWNAILTGYRYLNIQSETFKLFRQMIESGQKPNYVTMLNVLPACHTLLQGKSVHAYTLRAIILSETPLVTSLMIMYAKFKELSSCLVLFHTGEKKNISLWNTVISAHLVSNNSTMALSFFRNLLQQKIEPDVFTAQYLISACDQLKNLHISNSVLSFLLRKGFDIDTTISNALIDLYAKSGSLSYAITLFEVLPQKDTVSWATMIQGYALHGDVKAALSLYTKMRNVGVKPDKVTYVSILLACSHAGLVEHAQTVWESMLQDGLSPGPEHFACLVDLLSRTGHVSAAYEIVKNLPGESSPNLLESLLGACLSHENYEFGEEIGTVLLQMKLKNSGPYVFLHNIYAATGKWTEANSVRLLMEQGHIHKPTGISLTDGNDARTQVAILA